MIATVYSEEAYQTYLNKVDKLRDTHRYQLTYAEYKSHVKQVWTEIKNEFINNPAGVYIQNLGYFAKWLSPKKISKGASIERCLRTSLIAEDERNPRLRFFSADKTIQGTSDVLNLIREKKQVPTLKYTDTILNTQLDKDRFRTAVYRRTNTNDVLDFLLGEVVDE